MYYKNDHRITLQIPASVMGQIKCIVEHFDTEVSWYGDITQEDDVITINKVYLFPQVVTGGTFRTDTPQVSELYDSWYSNKLDEMAADAEATGVLHPVMQYNGHSHVNMGVSPSGEDITFRKKREGLNVYSIHNKSNAVSWEVWTDDVVYEPTDINVVYIDEVFDNSKEYVLKPDYSQNCFEQRAGATRKGYTTQQKKPEPTVAYRRSLIDEVEEDFDSIYGMGSYYDENQSRAMANALACKEFYHQS